MKQEELLFPDFVAHYLSLFLIVKLFFAVENYKIYITDFLANIQFHNRVREKRWELTWNSNKASQRIDQRSDKIMSFECQLCIVKRQVFFCPLAVINSLCTTVKERLCMELCILAVLQHDIP